MNVLITGANRGLGFEIAAEALERGHSVIAGTRNPSDHSGKFASLAAKYPERLSAVTLDVTEEETLAALAAELTTKGVQIDAIVNNAAILVGRDTTIETLDMADIVKSFEVNLFGPMKVVKHFLPLMPGSGDGKGAIINISSEAGSISNAYGGDYPYAISKTALNMFSQQMNNYVGKRGIQVLSVHPGWMWTDMGGSNAPTDPRDSARGILDLIERKTVTDSRYAFVDYTGKPMPI